MSVEWLRSCYASTWQLFRDDQGITTRGRYFFSPPGTPFYPGVHNLGSAAWHDKNWTHTVQLGEQVDAVRKWDRGRMPAMIPLPVIGGNRECIGGGERIADAIDTTTLIDGFPPACFVQPAAAANPFPHAAALERCSVQRFYARMLDLLYEDNHAAIVDAFAALLGGGITTTIHRSTDLLPSVATVIHQEFSLCVVDGTRHFLQLACQALQSIRSPTDKGELATVPLWWDASDWINAHLSGDGMDPAKPIVFAGHSYGAAAACVLAARYRHNRPDRDIRVITYGCPKVGDSRLVDLLNRCQVFGLANHDDIITTIPPDDAALRPLLIAIGHPELLVWTHWKRAPAQMIQDEDGALTPGPPGLLDFETLAIIAEGIISGDAVIPVTGHRIGEYIRRIEKRCPNAGWPVSADVIDEWDGLPLTGFLLLGGELSGAGASYEGGVLLGGELSGAGASYEGGVLLGGELSGAGAEAEGGVLLGGELSGAGAEAEGGVALGGELAEAEAEAEGGVALGGELIEL